MFSSFSVSDLLFSLFFSFISFCVRCRAEARAGRGGMGPPNTGTRGAFKSNPEGKMLLISLLLRNSGYIRTDIDLICRTSKAIDNKE